MGSEVGDWDESMRRLLDHQDTSAGTVGDLRSYLIDTITAAMLASHALDLDPISAGALAEVAVDVMIEVSHEITTPRAP